MTKTVEKGVSKEDMAVALAVADLDKLCGVGSVMDGNTVLDIEKCSSGSLGLDIALGGGYGFGRIVEIYGPESAGKSTLTLHAIVEAQKKHPEKWCAIVDSENAYDPEYAKGLGINMERVKISQPDNGEQALDIVDRLVKSGAFSIIVVDSVAALTPKAEIDGDMGDNQMGLQARMMGKGLRKITGNVNKAQTILLFINQLRMKIGVMFGSPETTPAGNALKFYASQRLDIRKSQGEKDADGNDINNRTKVKVVKNKIAPPFRKCEFNIGYGTGIDRAREVLDIGTEIGIIQKGGAWYSFEETKLGQGAQKSADMLRDNPDLMEPLEAAIREYFNIK